MKCLNCGNAFDGAKGICDACGTKHEVMPLSTPVIIKAEIPAEKPAEPKKPKKKKEK